MLRYRLGFVSTIDTAGIEAFHHAAAIFTRDENAPERYGRAPVLSLLVESGSFHIPKAGVHVVYGSNEDKVARIMRSKSCKRLIVVTPTKPKKGGAILNVTERIKAFEVEFVQIKKSKECTARDVMTGGVCEVVDLSAPAAHPTGAPSTPPREVKAQEHEAPSINTGGEAKPRVHEAPNINKPAERREED